MADKMEMQFALPPPPRRVRITKRGRLARSIILGILGLLLGIIVVGSNYGYRRSIHFRDSGAMTKSTIVDKYETDDDYYVVVSYLVGGNRHEKTLSVIKAQYKGWAKHDTVDITYLPNDPQDVEIGPVTSASVKYQRDAMLGFYVMYIPFAWLVFVFCDMSVRRQRRLVRLGILSTAEVTDTWRKSDGGLTIDYRYSVDGVSYTRRGYAPGYVAATPGGSLAILYMPRNPRFSMLLDAITLAQPG